MSYHQKTSSHPTVKYTPRNPVDAIRRRVVRNSPFPGFDGLRLAAATSVLFSHAFLIAEGTDDSEPLRHLLGPGNIIGLYGVFTFFIISGFLLTRSLATGPEWSSSRSTGSCASSLDFCSALWRPRS